MPLVKVKTKIRTNHIVKIDGVDYNLILGGDEYIMTFQIRSQGCDPYTKVFEIIPHYNSLCSSVYKLRRAGILSDKKAINMLAHIVIAFQAGIDVL